MTKTVQCHVAVTALLLAVAPAYAGPCSETIASIQAEVDAAIENRAGADGWKAESPNALRSHQPTPRSLAASEGREGARFEYALDALDRARAADRLGDSATCHQQLVNARSVLSR